jgi:hypothetical protein
MIDDDTVCRNFEKDILLFIDRDLPMSQFEEFNNHVHSCKNCSELLRETVDIIYSGKNGQINIPDELFDAMIAKSIKTGNKRFSFIENPLHDRKEKIVFYWKIALASVLIFASITISLLTNRANPVKQVSREFLDWEGTKIEADLNTVKQSINLMNKEDWNTKVSQIDQGLDQLEKQTDKFSFN